MKAIQLTLLAVGQIWKHNGQIKIDVLKEYGTKAVITDLAIITGCNMSNQHLENDSSFKGITGDYYTCNAPYCISSEGNKYIDEYTKRNKAVRPIIKADEELLNNLKITNNIAEYGEFPQFAPSKNIQNQLESTLHEKILEKTGRKFTFDAENSSNDIQEILPESFEEYEYQNKKYIRMNHKNQYNRQFKLSNGENYTNNDYIWLEVSPVRWLVDKKKKLLISEYGLVSGIGYTNKNINDNNFNNTEMKKYLDIYMSKEMFTPIPDKSKTRTDTIKKFVLEINLLLKNYYVNNNIKNQIKEKIIKYNQDVTDSFYKTKEYNLNMENNSDYIIFLHLVNDLSEIRDMLKKYQEDNKEYLNILIIIKDCYAVLNTSIEDLNDELLIDLSNVKKLIQKLPDQKQEIDYLNHILEREKNKVIENLKGNHIKMEYMSTEEFKKFIRNKIQPYLINLGNENKSIKEINNYFTNSENDYINYYLEEIKKLIQIIKKKGNNIEISNLESIIRNQLDEKIKTDEVKMLYISLYQIVLEIEERENTKETNCN